LPNDFMWDETVDDDAVDAVAEVVLLGKLHRLSEPLSVRRVHHLRRIVLSDVS